MPSSERGIPFWLQAHALSAETRIYAHLDVLLVLGN